MDDDEKIQALADTFQALSDPNRLRILSLLLSAPGPICVNAIAMAIGISQSAVSQHLKVLRNRGFVTVKKEGYYKHYAINYDNSDSIRLMKESVLGAEFKL